MRRARKAALLAPAPVLAAAVAVALGAGRGEKSACTLEQRPEQEAAHVTSLPPGFSYNSFPPTSGPSAERPLVWKEYRRPVSQLRLVHNLLHGGVAVQYGRDVSRRAIDELRAWYRADPDGIVLAPLPRLDRTIALTAWRNLARCGGFHERGFNAFRSRHRFNGPERPPRETMRPGRGGVANALGLRVSPSPVSERATLTFRLAEAATVEVEIRAGGPSGRVVRRLGRISTMPGAAVGVTWDRRSDAGRRVRAGAYAVVARVIAGARPSSSASVFEIR